MKTTVKTENSVIKGAVSLTISAILVKIIGLIYKIPLSYILSDEGMGYFNSAYTVYTFFYLICTAGIPKAIAIIVGENGNESCERREEIYKSAVFVFLGLGLIVTVLFILFSKYFSIGIGNSSAYFTMISVAPSILFVCLAGVIRGYFNGILKLFPIAVSEIISSIFKLFLGILLVFIGKRLDFSLPVLSALAIFGTTVGAFLGFMYLYLCKKREERKSKVKIKQQ